MAAMRLVWLIAMLGTGLLWSAAVAVPPQDQWQQPASALAEQIAGILGPGQAQLIIRNISTISSSEIAGIRKLLEQDLKAHGVLVSGLESANAIRVTLSENSRERLWVAEVVEGSETKVAMVHLDPAPSTTLALENHMVLRKERLRIASPSNEPVLAAVEAKGDLLLLHPQSISVLKATEAGWAEQKSFSIGHRENLTRDPRGLLSLDQVGSLIAFLPGMQCTGSRDQMLGGSTGPPNWTVQCQASDDPWPIATTNGAAAIKAFFSPARNYFTGIVIPDLGGDLPPFYSAAPIPRPGSAAALLITGIDGKVQLLDNGVLKQVSGTRDWGSDFAVLQSGCGAGTQVIASGSGEAGSDSLRAYEIPALEVVPASAPLAMDGSVTALWTAPDGKSVLSAVRSATDEYEVDRVTALCN